MLCVIRVPWHVIRVWIIDLKKSGAKVWVSAERILTEGGVDLKKLIIKTTKNVLLMIAIAFASSPCIGKLYEPRVPQLLLELDELRKEK